MESASLIHRPLKNVNALLKIWLGLCEPRRNLFLVLGMVDTVLFFAMLRPQ